MDLERERRSRRAAARSCEGSRAARHVPGPLADGLHEWILGLPWVIERPYSLDTPGVRTFAVECEPLARRRMWLVSGLREGSGISVIVPADVATRLEQQGLATASAPMPPGHVLVAVDDDLGMAALERVVLDAYSHALA